MASFPPSGSSQSPPLAGVLRLTRGSSDAARAAAIVDRLMQEARYDRAFANELAAIARGRQRASWDLRRVACLALETQFLRIDDAADLPSFFRILQLLTRGGTRIRRIVREDGFSRTDVAGFAAELRERVMRFEWIHDGLSRRDGRAMDDFLAHAHHECLLTLARYLLRPREVVAEIVTRLKRTRGLPHMPVVNPFNRDEARRALAMLPRYERAIAELLMREPVVYWVANTTPSEINTLVECPIGTVALVVKPPGSDLEIEIKRTGTRGPRTVDCVYQTPGAAAPLTALHHFYGGSYGRLLRWELTAGSTLARLYRSAYGAEAPTSRIVHMAGVLDVPGPCGDVSFVSYFGRREGYGDGYDAMRAAMERAVPRLEHVRLPVAPGDPGGFGLTGKWIAVTSPEQALIVNTSSFRLDRLATYLGAGGLDAYLDVTPEEARRFADMLLSEILGSYTPPGPYRSWPDYVDAAFAVPENRRSADEAYVEILRQFGDYYGFFCAFRATSGGESFVERNVGLRRVFRGGAWRTQVIFMDHDAVVLAGRDYSYCDPEDFLDRAFFDLTHMLGGTVRFHTRGCAGALKAIFRVSEAVAAEGLRALKQAFRERYAAGQQAIAQNEELQRMFRKEFVESMLDWDDVLRHFLAARRKNVPPDTWRRSAMRRLRKRGYKARRARMFVQAMEEFALLLPWFGFLFEETGASSVLSAEC